VTVIHNTYSKTVINRTSNRVSFNGGRGGTTARPSSAEMAVAHERHRGPTSAQARQQHEASTNRAQFASVNHGRPDVVATPKPGDFRGGGVVTARASTSSHEASSRAAESSRTNRTSNNATEHGSRARSESKTLTPAKRENNVKPNSTSPRTEAKPVERQTKPPARHQSSQPPPMTERTPRREATPAQHQAVPQAQHQSAPRPAETQRAPRAETRPPQHQATPPAQHPSAPREEKKTPRG
jgi:hypothetical protein